MAHDDLASDVRWHRTLLGHVSEGAILLDCDGRFLYANAAATRLFHTPETGLIGSFFTCLLHPLDRDDVAARLAALSRTEHAFAKVTCRAQTPAGAWAWIEAKLRHAGDIGGIVGTCVDVTGVRQSRESREALADASWAQHAID